MTKRDAEQIEAKALRHLLEVLGADASDQVISSALQGARSRWHDYADRPETIRPSREMKADLEEFAGLAAALVEKMQKVREYEQLKVFLFFNRCDGRDENPGSPFDEAVLQNLILAAKSAEMTAEQIQVARGAPVEIGKRLAYIDASQLYAERTGRSPYPARGKDGELSGPYVDFMLAFSSFCFPANRHSAEEVIAFARWQRQTRQQGRDPMLATIGLDPTMA